MSDDLTPQERDMIDAAVRAGKVSKVPRGQSGVVVYRRKCGRRADIAAIKMIERLADREKSDVEIAEELGRSQKAVSNMRYRHGIENGFRRRSRL